MYSSVVYSSVYLPIVQSITRTLHLIKLKLNPLNNSPFLCSIFDLVTHGQAPAIHRHIQVRGSRSGRMADDIFMNLRSFLEVDILVIAWAYLVARKPRKMWPPKNSINMDKNFSHNTLSFFFFYLHLMMTIHFLLIRKVYFFFFYLLPLN